MIVYFCHRFGSDISYLASKYFLRSGKSNLQIFRNISLSAIMSKKKIPDRWEDYETIGNVIEGTRFISFKVPLNEYLSRSLPDDATRFTPEDLPAAVQKQNRELGLVVDLTNTDRYYKPQLITRQGIEYKKIFTEGHCVPSKDVQNRFFEAVDDFLRANEDNDRLVGVHCTHGVNRTGYLVCRYMIDRMKFEADDAIKAFNEARGHSIERQNYLNDLRGIPSTETFQPEVNHHQLNRKWTATPNSSSEFHSGQRHGQNPSNWNSVDLSSRGNYGSYNNCPNDGNGYRHSPSYSAQTNRNQCDSRLSFRDVRNGRKTPQNDAQSYGRARDDYNSSQYDFRSNTAALMDEPPFQRYGNRHYGERHHPWNQQQMQRPGFSRGRQQATANSAWGQSSSDYGQFGRRNYDDQSSSKNRQSSRSHNNSRR